MQFGEVEKKAFQPAAQKVELKVGQMDEKKVA
jgi:hypothetical protein